MFYGSRWPATGFCPFDNDTQYQNSLTRVIHAGAELCMDAYRASLDLMIIFVFHSLEEIKMGDQHQTMMGNERVKCF